LSVYFLYTLAESQTSCLNCNTLSFLDTGAEPHAKFQTPEARVGFPTLPP